MAHLIGILCLSFIALLLPACLAYQRERKRWKISHIPGPSGSVVCGNSQQLGPSPWRQLIRWAEEYGELFHIRLGTEHFVYLNSPQAVREVFDRQSAKTSCKGPLVGASEIISGNRIAVMPYSTRWRRLRGAIHQFLHPAASVTYRPSQEFEAKQLLFDILEDQCDPVTFGWQARRFSLSVILTATYGLRAPSNEIPVFGAVYKIMEEFSEATAPGAFATDILPQLSNLPVWLQWWRYRARRYYQNQCDLWSSLWMQLKQKLDDGRAPPCFAKHFMQAGFEHYDISELQSAFLAGTLIEAGSDTTAAALNTAVLYLAANPLVQTRLNEDLTRLVGDNRSPSFADIDKLPIIKACVQEVSRIRPLNRFGTPHYTTADVVYKHFTIPKGTFVLINQYAIHASPQYYRDPFEFDPTRFMETAPNIPGDLNQGQQGPAGHNRRHFNFGAGRRVCPGAHIAEGNLSIALAKIIWAFEIEPPRGAEGNVAAMNLSDDAFEPGANSVPKPFQVRFLPRNTWRAKTVRDEWLQAMNTGFVVGDVKVDLDGVIPK